MAVAGRASRSTVTIGNGSSPPPHLVGGVDPARIKVVRSDGVSLYGLELISSNPLADVAVFSLFQKQLTPNMLLETGSDGLQYGQDVYFLGFPLGWSVQNDQERLPFVKKAIMSGVTATTDGVNVWMFDGMNVNGFSGGPLEDNRRPLPRSVGLWASGEPRCTATWQRTSRPTDSPRLGVGSG
jgi:hypothetical protein